MYVMSKRGFVEVDRYDGSGHLPIGHLVAINDAAAVEPGCTVVIVRSREESTLRFAICYLKREPVIFKTPTWDYEFRVYLTLSEWVAVLAAFCSEIDYRSFKTWCHDNSSIEHATVAVGIWQEATLLRSR